MFSKVRHIIWTMHARPEKYSAAECKFLYNPSVLKFHLVWLLGNYTHMVLHTIMLVSTSHVKRTYTAHSLLVLLDFYVLVVVPGVDSLFQLLGIFWEKISGGIKMKKAFVEFDWKFFFISIQPHLNYEAHFKPPLSYKIKKKHRKNFYRHLFFA